MTPPEGQNTAAAGDKLAAAALAYAEAGLAVFPLKPGSKVPATLDGLKSATCDAEQVRAWWQRWPDANVAVRTGGESGLVVLDVDVQRGGAGTLAKLERAHGRLPRTAETLTGGGGRHLLFRHPGREVRNSVDKLGPGLDVRGDEGYIVAPPSIHDESGRPYRWTRALERGLVDPPAWLLEADAQRRNGAAPKVGAVIPQGQRNATLTSLAGTMRRRGMSAPEILAALKVVNAERCEPPPLSDDELLRIAESVARYEPATQPPTSAQSAARGTSQGLMATPPGLEWQWLREVSMRSIVFLDKPLLQASAFHLFTGRKGMGKGTFIAGFAARFTRGELGHKRNVIWIASEDSLGIDIHPRIVAAGGDPARIRVVRTGWVQLPHHLADVRQEMDNVGDVGLVVIDPLSAHIAGKDSNSETDIRDALGPLNQLADDYDCVVVGVRHLSEKECSRGLLAAILGSSAWVQIPRAVLAIVRDDEDPSISHVQVVAGNRLSADTPGRMFRIEGVLLPGLENEVTRATWIGDSTKDVETMLGSDSKRPAKSAVARELVLNILENEGEQESDTLDARVAKETGLAARSVRDLRSTLVSEGLIKAMPDKDEAGTILCWRVYRTAAPR